MTRFLTLPDLEAVSSISLRAANIPNVEGVHSSIPAKNPVYPLLVVQRIGGVPSVREYLDRARIQTDVWGGARKEGERSIPKSTILDIAQAARGVLLEMEGTIVSDVFVSAVEDALGVMWQPDPTSGRDRYVFSMWVYGRPAEVS